MAAVGNGWDLISTVVWIWCEPVPQGFMLWNLISIGRCEKAGHNPTLEFSNGPLLGDETEINLCHRGKAPGLDPDCCISGEAGWAGL